MSDSPKPPPRRTGRWVVVAFVLALAGTVGASLFTNLGRQYAAEPAGADCPKASDPKFEPLRIETGGKTVCFLVEVMRTDADRSRGLMFRQSMPPDYGMLFDFERDQPVSMWMKNTFISLDMLFVFSDGRIHRIEARTEPESERVIPAGVPVRAVLELNANTAQRLGIKPGDRLRHPMFR